MSMSMYLRLSFFHQCRTVYAVCYILRAFGIKGLSVIEGTKSSNPDLKLSGLTYGSSLSYLC